MSVIQRGAPLPGRLAHGFNPLDVSWLSICSRLIQTALSQSRPLFKGYWDVSQNPKAKVHLGFG